MKKIFVLIQVVAALFLFACGGGDEQSVGDASSVTELSLSTQVSGAIAVEKEVDWYHFRAVEANRVLQIDCISNTLRPDVDLLVTVYEVDGNGNKVRLYAEHAREGSLSPADLKMNIFIDRPKDLFISVRDLLDNEGAPSETYYLTLRFEGNAEGNDNFSDALAVTVDDESSCLTDTIGRIGDVDVFSFDVASAGIYNFSTDFQPFPDTNVALSVSLFNSSGTLLRSLNRRQSFQYDIVSYLTSGTYYVVVEDNGQDDFDLSSPFEVCASSVESDEMFGNDSIAAATANSLSTVVNGSLDYWGDEDWHQFILPAAGSGIQVVTVNFDDNSSLDIDYEVELIDADENLILSHLFHGGSSAYETQLMAGVGPTHYVVVKAVDGETATDKAPYSFSIDVATIEDLGEAGDGNNSQDTATPLVATSDPAGGTEGKVSFRGDVDYFSIAVPDTTSPQVLELFFESAAGSAVEYDVKIIRDSAEDVKKRIHENDGEEGSTNMKTSILIPATDAENVVYYFKVSDYQSNEGADHIYKIRANLSAIPTTVSSGIYYNEATEEEDSSAEIKLRYNAIIEKIYTVNTTLLDIEDPVAGTTIVADSPGLGLTTITFPWVTGYIDYQSDQDWFLLPNTAFEDADSNWYYDIKVEMVVGNPGSSVEYVWKLFPDRNNNGIAMERTSGSDGFMASAGDPSTAIAPLDITVPENVDQEFWIGDRWEGNTYFSISDFNFIASETPDDDWGYDVPYSFRITLVYHPGVSDPD